MPYDTSRDTITIGDVEYNVNRTDHNMFTELTVDWPEGNVIEGLVGRLGYDDCPDYDSPREWGNVGTISVSYPRYDLGDEDISKIDFEIECPNCEGEGFIENDESGSRCTNCEGSGEIDVNPADYFRKERKARVVIGLFVYEHSGITMSAGPTIGPTLKDSDVRSTGRFMGDDAGWDTSFVGFIYDTPEKVKECMGDNEVTDEKIEEILRAEVAVYASYLEGDVTEFSVEDEETGFYEGCGGFVGDSKECESQCFSALESAIVKRHAEIAERAEWAARDTITN